MSTLSDYSVRLLHRSMQVDVRALLGKPLTLTINTAAAPRHINGVIASFALVGQEGDADRYFVYEARVVPWFWLASHKKEFRIYQNQSVPEIVKQVLTPYGYAFAFDLVESYAPRVYCVQYDETDFQFVSRLLEAEGIHYYFHHEQKQHTLVMSDEIQSHKHVDGYKYVRYFTEDKLALPQQDYMTHVAVYQDLRPGQYTTNDYDFTKPKVNLAAREQIKLEHEHNQAEIYEWPGNYRNDPLGERYARQRMQEQHHVRDTRMLRSTARGVATGSLFNLMSCPRIEENREYVVLSTRYDLKESNYHSVSSLEEAAQNGRRCLFDLTVQCATLPFRPPRVTRKPRTQGPQTAVVVGPEGKEIWTNEYGQVKVHFHWDRYDKKDENSSCWIRVSSSWASGSFGAIQVPRIGDEVIVDFLNGDPDEPIITGRVYNAAMMPPWALPDNATRMGMHSRSTPDGTYTTANSIRLEDKMGQEELFMHAQKDFHTGIRNNSNTHNLSSSLTAAQDVVISAGQRSRMYGTASRDYFAPSRYYVNYRELSRLNDTVADGRRGALYLTSRADTTVHSGGDVQAFAEESVMMTAKAGMSLVSQKDLRIDAAGSLVQSAEDRTIITPEDGLVLKCGEAHLILRPNGDIEMSGGNIKINGTTICLN